MFIGIYLPWFFVLFSVFHVIIMFLLVWNLAYFFLCYLWLASYLFRQSSSVIANLYGSLTCHWTQMAEHA